MTNGTANLTSRLSYLERELAVWRGRLAAMPSYSLYDDHDLRIELGKMRGEAERIKLELSSAAKPIRDCCGRKRRANPKKEN